MKRIRLPEDINIDDLVYIKKVKNRALKTRMTDKSNSIVKIIDYDGTEKGRLAERISGEIHEFDSSFFIELSESYVLDDEFGKLLYEE